MSDRRVRELTSEQEERIIHTLPMWARKRLKRAEIMLTAHASNYCREKERAERAEADNAKLRECVAAADAMRDSGEADDCFAYDRARSAELGDKP